MRIISQRGRIMAGVETEPALHIIREPKVYLVGRQVVDEEALAAFLSDHDVSHWSTDSEVAGEKLIETAGRVCYMSFQRPRPGGNRAYIGHLLEVGHGSVLEHAVFNLLITGVSRSLTHELVRHRAGFGFSQLSQRFVDESQCSFVEPEVIADDPELHRLWLDAVQASQVAYRALADRLTAKLQAIPDRTARRKKAREAARSVLPNATETEIFVTANARALRHFIEMRGDAAADVEIRRLAIAVFKLLEKEAPNLFGDYTLIDLPEGGQAVTTEHRKV
jgi:thymidylate synthase (FAD)